MTWPRIRACLVVVVSFGLVGYAVAAWTPHAKGASKPSPLPALDEQWLQQALLAEQRSTRAAMDVVELRAVLAAAERRLGDLERQQDLDARRLKTLELRQAGIDPRQVLAEQ